jgi:hypothetical protein
MVPTRRRPKPGCGYKEDIEAAIDRAMVDGYTDDGMPADCVLNFDNLALLRKGWFVAPICQLSPVRTVQACRALAVAMGC